MAPVATGQDEVNRPWYNVVSGSDAGNGHAHAVFVQNRKHIRFRQFGVGVALSFCLASLLVAVCGVRDVRASEEVCRIATRRVVAAMQDANVVRQVSSGQPGSGAVRASGPSSSSNHPVAVSVDRARPRPARVRPAGFVHLRPEVTFHEPMSASVPVGLDGRVATRPAPPLPFGAVTMERGQRQEAAAWPTAHLLKHGYAEALDCHAA